MFDKILGLIDLIIIDNDYIISRNQSRKKIQSQTRNKKQIFQMRPKRLKRMSKEQMGLIKKQKKVYYRNG